MTNYRRNFICGGSFFFTANLAERRLRLLVDYIDLLRQAFRMQQRQPVASASTKNASQPWAGFALPPDATAAAAVPASASTKNASQPRGTLRFAIAIGLCLAVTALAMSMRIASIAIFAVFLLGLPARSQSFSRQDLDCAVVATIEDARSDKDPAGENIARQLLIFFLGRLNAQDDQTNWARLAYDRSKLSPKRDTAELLAKCTELYQSSLHR